MHDFPVPPNPGIPAGPAHRGRHDGGRTARPTAAGSRSRTHRRPVPRLAGGPRPFALPGSEEVTVRRIGPEDRSAARELHERCSATTLTGRYHGPAGDADRYLTHLLDPRHGHTLAAESAPGRPVALGHLLWDGEEAEVALLVEDGWQGRGVGSLLLRRLVALARENRRDTLYAVARPSNTPMVAAMRSLGLPLEQRLEDGALVLCATLGKSANSAEVAAVCGRK